MGRRAARPPPPRGRAPPHRGLRHREHAVLRAARDQLDVRGRGAARGRRRALHAASAEDVLEALPDGLDPRSPSGAGRFSGGQRQRLVLARALAADPEVLVLVEPTSAVDAHTEARIADRLRDHRAGRTTVVTTTSPLMLDRADEVVFLADGRVAAVGPHRELLHESETAPYRAVVTARGGGARMSTTVRSEDMAADTMLPSPTTPQVRATSAPCSGGTRGDRRHARPARAAALAGLVAPRLARRHRRGRAAGHDGRPRQRAGRGHRRSRSSPRRC